MKCRARGALGAPIVRRSARFGAWLCAAVLLAGCMGSPYVDSRREAGQKKMVGLSNPNMVAVCYAGDPVREGAEAIAQAECEKIDRSAKFDHASAWSCTLLTPTRAFYRCISKP